MRDQIFSQPGIILKKIPYSESDEIISVLLRDDGVRRFFVAGSRKSRKRYQGIIDVFAHLDFQYRASDKGLWRLQGAEIIKGAAELPTQDIEVYAYFHFIAELMCELAPEAINDHQFYELWMQIQKDIQEGEFSLQRAVHYLMQIFARTGYEITHDRCVLCDSRQLSEKVGFDHMRGGVVCPECCGSGELKFEQSLFDPIEATPSQESNHLALMVKLVTFAQNIIQKSCRSAGFYLGLIRVGGSV